jgi:predicted enzyme related to lactoylglutathione lyase
MQARRIETVLQWVADVDASMTWYSDFLGVEVTPYEARFFKFGDNAYLILAPSSPGTGRGGTGGWFEVGSVDEAYAELTARGYTFNEEPFDIPPGRLVTVNDPGGNILGLIDNSNGGMPGLDA